MSGTVNPNIPAITQPIANTEANTRVLLQVRQAIQSLAGQIGGPNDRAVTFHDLSTTTNTLNSLASRIAVIEKQLGITPPPVLP